MISYGARGCMAGLMDLYNDVGGNVVAVEQCALEDTSKYGIVGMGDKTRHGFEVTQMVEKPPVAEAPSTYYLNGRYILQPEIFSILAHQQRGAGNEIQLTDGMLRLSADQSFHAHPYEGRTFDCGSKQGFIEANVAFALARADIGNLVFESVREMVLSHEQAMQAA